MPRDSLFELLRVQGEVVSMDTPFRALSGLSFVGLATLRPNSGSLFRPQTRTEHLLIFHLTAM